MRKKGILTVLLMVSMALTGCMQVETTMDLSKEEGKADVSGVLYYDKEAFDSMFSDSAASSEGMTKTNGDVNIKDLPVEEINGKEYYVQKEDKGLQTLEEVNTGAYVITNNSFYLGLQVLYKDNNDPEIIDENLSAMLGGMVDRTKIEVKFGDEIINSNGVVSEDKKSVIFDLSAEDLSKTDEIYAYTEKAVNTIEEDRALAIKRSSTSVSTSNFATITENYNKKGKLTKVIIKPKKGVKVTFKYKDKDKKVKKSNGKYVLTKKGTWKVTLSKDGLSASDTYKIGKKVVYA